MEKVDGVHANLSPQPLGRHNRMQEHQPTRIVGIIADVSSVLCQRPENDPNQYPWDSVRTQK